MAPRLDVMWCGFSGASMMTALAMRLPAFSVIVAPARRKDKALASGYLDADEARRARRLLACLRDQFKFRPQMRLADRGGGRFWPTGRSRRYRAIRPSALTVGCRRRHHRPNTTRLNTCGATADPRHAV